jgi:hypothetical protein
LKTIKTIDERKTEIVVLDEKGQGGAHHEYEVRHFP